MISPKPDPATASAFRSRTDDFFRPTGTLARAARKSDFAYETRPQQYQMALAVARVVEEGGALVVEAGTGVGKTFS